MVDLSDHKRCGVPDGKYRSNYVITENGRKYGLVGLKRCKKIDGETENIDPYTGSPTIASSPK